MRINARYCKLGGLLFLALATIIAFHRQSDASKTADEKTAEQPPAQVVDQVEPLCRILFPDQDVLRFRAVPSSIHHKGSHSENLWSVDCQDTNSNVIASLTWNPDTKRTLQFCAPLFSFPPRQKHSPQSMDEKQAVAIAREWVSRLRPVSGAALQQSQYQAQRNSFSWTVRLQLPDGAVRVWINPQSGKLQKAIMQDAPDPDIPDATTGKRR